MCGIFGFIGKSTNPKVSFDLANALFLKTEIRGEHASGFWGCEADDGCVVYDKEPLKSSSYINHDIWKKGFGDLNADLLIGHCRLTSQGHERVNRNNHPHWSDDKKVAMVHNGKIPEYNALKGRYDTNSECDSEILLRMFESAEAFKDQEEFLKKEFPTMPPFLAYRLLGLKEIFSRVNYGAMAVAIGERADDGNRYLWLFRDDDRPLHVVDMRKTLGQIFFCSTAEIWRASVDACPSVKPFIPQDQVIIEFPVYQVWLLATNLAAEEEAKRWNIRKFKITKTKYYDWQKEEEEEDKFLAAKKKEAAEKPKPVSSLKVMSRLGKDDIIVQPKKRDNFPDDSTSIDEKSGTTPPPLPSDKKKATPNKDNASEGVSADHIVNGWDDDEPPNQEENELTGFSEIDFSKSEGIDMDAFDTAASEIEAAFEKLKTKVHNLAQEGSLSGKDFSCIMDSMQSLKCELSGTLHIVNEE